MTIKKDSKPGIVIFLQIWQILELTGLLFSIPLVFFFGILFTGDSSKTFNFVNMNIIPAISIFLLLKIIVTIFFFKSKRWTIYFNFFQNLLLVFIQLIIIVISFIAVTANVKSKLSDYFSMIPGFFLLGFYLFLLWGFRQCLQHPFYQKNNHID